MEIKNCADIPTPFRRIFEHYPSFNAVQSSLLNVLLHTNRSVVLSAPTGSGKTVAFELAIVRMLHDLAHDTNSAQEQCTRVTPVKAVYVAPIKALCAERFDDWNRRFKIRLGIECLLITGDSELDELARLHSAQVIITTPEKWDSLTRHWRDCRDVISSIRLFLIDEVHLLNEDVRGPVLEAIVSRMHTIACDAMNKPLRFVVASATIPNVHDITCWISGIVGGGSNRINHGTVAELVYSDADRPVPLEKHVLGFNWSLRGFKFDMSLNYKLLDILRKYADCKATLIFCNSRKSAEMAATVLEKNITTLYALSDQQKTNLTQLVQDLHDSKLRKLIAHGIAYHHAGMSLSDRSKIEESFRQGNLMVLLCTNTLAMGVNLPARLVVIKSTEYYHLGNMMEYPESTLLQMIGRAGRPQYDTKGVAVILTHMRNVHKYETLMNGTMPIESHLHKHLAEHLNSEIALGTIKNLEVAMQWMRSTYFYVRSMQNPLHYGLEQNTDKDIIEHKLEKLCFVQIQELANAGLISKNPQNELDVQTTSYGKLMAKYYVCFETMKLFRQIRGDESFLKILELIVRCREFSDFTLRVNEKRLLNALNDAPLRFPRAGRIKTREDKISCLLQAILGNIPIASPTLAQESLKMLRIGDRIAKCLLEYMRLAEHQASSTLHLGRYKALLHTVTIAKCFHAKLWENSEYAAKQLQKIGAVYSAQLVCAGKTTLKSLGATDARTIEAILNKSYPFGDEILQNLQQTFPEYSLQLARVSLDLVRVCVRQVNEAFICRGINALLIIGDSANQLLLFIEDLDSLLLEYGSFMKTIKLPNTDVEKLHAHVIHATLVGADVHETLIINEPVVETTTVSKAKKAKKRNKQTSETTISNKKAKPNLSNTISTICDTTIDSTVADKSKRFLKLQSFTFSKSKLTNDSIKTKPGEEEDQNFPKSKMYTKNYFNITDTTVNDESFNTTAKQFSNNSTLVQSRLTQYFTQRKHINDKSLTMQSMQSDDESEKSDSDKNNNELSAVMPEKMLDTTLIRYQRYLKQRDLEFDKLKESQNKLSNEPGSVVIRGSTAQKTPDSIEATKECDVIEPDSPTETKNVEESLVHTTLRATTPDLHEISAFLDTQISKQSNKGTQGSITAEYLGISTNGPTIDYSILNDTQNAVLLNTQSSSSTREAVQSSTLRKAQSSISGMSNIGAEHSILHEKSKNTTVNSFNSVNCGVVFKILNCGVSSTMQKEFVRINSKTSNSDEALDLSRKSKDVNSTNAKDVKRLKAAKSPLKNPQNTSNTDIVKKAKITRRQQLQQPGEDNCVLDLSHKTATNLNMTWCDSLTVAEASAGNCTRTRKSSDTLSDSPKCIKNYIRCYKVATAYARLKESERTIGNFKNLYMRVWHTNTAIDYITQKLSNSSISHEKEQKTVPAQQAVLKRNIKSVIEKSELPLNMSKKLQEKQVNNALNNVKINKSNGTVVRAKLAKNSAGKMCAKVSKNTAKENTSSTNPNRFRLQLMDEVNSDMKNSQHINNDVMHLVLNMKCKALDTNNKGNQAKQNVENKAIAEDAELNETESLPSMSFEEYCSYVLQTPSK
ncbi:probable ATP-dependent DNA helicase HFM1 [Zeugodacus cucurbitae]|uniref:probable ATP-dependent DNA helicase HFM1 n=1 Tax=Zeugodacus cucurbitae TaxID=28588 RepID=UPI0023D90134|nr:probable ATP-dependent DNA helicase HFM1 [Zeugodacus cucurbitae]